MFATAFLDIINYLQHLVFDKPLTRYEFIGRWVIYMTDGIFSLLNLSKTAAPRVGEVSARMARALWYRSKFCCTHVGVYWIEMDASPFPFCQLLLWVSQPAVFLFLLCIPAWATVSLGY